MTKPSYPDIHPIPDTPENIANTIMKGLPKKNWDFEKESEEAEKPASDQPPG